MRKQITKRIFILMLMSALFVTGCSKKVVCDFCDEKKSCTTKKVAGEKVNICDDCTKEFSE